MIRVWQGATDEETHKVQKFNEEQLSDIAFLIDRFVFAQVQWERAFQEDNGLEMIRWGKRSDQLAESLAGFGIETALYLAGKKEAA